MAPASATTATVVTTVNENLNVLKTYPLRSDTQPVTVDAGPHPPEIVSPHKHARPDGDENRHDNTPTPSSSAASSPASSSKLSRSASASASTPGSAPGPGKGTSNTGKKQPRHGDVTKAPSFQTRVRTRPLVVHTNSHTHTHTNSTSPSKPLTHTASSGKGGVRSSSTVGERQEVVYYSSPHDVYCKAKAAEADDRLSEAMRLFQRAGNDGHVAAMVSYGLLLVGSDERAAFQWLRSAAERGHARAWYHLGQLFARGGAFEIAPADAAKCWHRAAQLGDPGGRSALGLCYIRGFGVKRDVAKGVAIVKQVAVLNDDVTAMKNLAWIYRHGKGVPQDLDEANFWFERALKRDDIVKDADLNWSAWNIRPV